MAITWAVVSRSLAVINPMPHLRLARLKHRSTSTRSHSSICACCLSGATFFFGLPVGELFSQRQLGVDGLQIALEIVELLADRCTRFPTVCGCGCTSGSPCGHICGNTPSVTGQTAAWNRHIPCSRKSIGDTDSPGSAMRFPHRNNRTLPGWCRLPGPVAAAWLHCPCGW